MLLDDDEQIISQAEDELYSIENVNKSILTFFDEVYEKLVEHEVGPYDIVSVDFTLHFKDPVKCVNEKSIYYGTTKIFKCNVGFYQYEYVGALHDYDKIKLRHATMKTLYGPKAPIEDEEHPIVWKTKNNFTIKAHENGLQIKDIRDVKFLITRTC